MKCWNGFGRGLLFAFLCAGAAPFYLGAAQIFLGWRLAFASYLLLAATVYLLGIARRPFAGLTAAGATGACGLALLVFGATGAELALVLGALIGLFRSGLLYPDRRAGARGFARRFAVEAGLIGAGLALGAYLLRGSLFPEAAALWGFFLVQSAFFLFAPAATAARSAAPEPAEIDPFERACRRARALLQQSP
ncbi:MAG: hypothetical protein V3V67_01240 [Myxococcota bacterium]